MISVYTQNVSLFFLSSLHSNSNSRFDIVHCSIYSLVLASSAFNPRWYSDVTGVEIAGALKNVLAIAAGIVEGMNLGNNSMAALVAQGCSEIRWLATKVCELIYASPSTR